MVRQTGKTAGVAVAALIVLGLGGTALAASGDRWDDRGSYRGDIYHRHDRPEAARHPTHMRPDTLWQHRQNVHRHERAERHRAGPVYDDRPWYGYGAVAHRSGPTIVYRNTYHYVTVPQPVYMHGHPGYYGGPHESYGYRHSACNSQVVGTVIGAILGGVIGADKGRGAGPVIGGALIGAVLGGALGHAIDASNWACVGDVLEYAPNRRAVSWRDAQTGYGYEVTPMRTYEPHPGRYCREYQTVVTIGGRAEEAYGTACRQPDGAWEIVNS
ncbi:MAG: hypothetical protein KF899_06585 [Parvibaculum sp.]|nr:hypothetical protein [Parvibaculum sp.]